MDLRHLYPRAGDDVLDWWEKVVAWARTLEVDLGPEAFATQGPNGLQITVRDSAPVRTPFRVGLTGRRVTVSPGFVDGRVPWIAAGSIAVRLDGTGPDGITPVSNGLTPGLDLRDAAPGEDGRSVIVVRRLVTERGVPIDDRETPEALQVLHVSEFSGAEKRRLAAAGVALQELAILYWRDGQPVRVAQVVRHNLQHSYAAGSEEDPPRHFFAAV